MPKNKSAAIRYRIIDQCLINKQHPYPNKEKLAQKISDVLGIPISLSTVEKDIRAMKSDHPEGFAAPIEFHTTRRGYYYAEEGFSITALQLQDEEWEALRMASALLFQYAEMPLFKNFKESIEKIDMCFGLGMNPADPDIEKVIQFDQSNSYSGYEWLATIHEAIKMRWPLKIRYENIYKEEIKEYLLQPCLLKEVRNRWYVIGWVEDRSDFLIFALDRIQSMDVIKKRHPLRNNFDASRFFENSIGIMQGNQKPQKIVLEIKAPYDRLTLLNPLHLSQKYLSHKNKVLKIELNLLVNDELYMRLLALGPFCKVLKPSGLATHLKEMLRSALKNYN